MRSEAKSRFYDSWGRTDWVHFYWWSALTIAFLGFLSLIGAVIIGDQNQGTRQKELESEAFELCMGEETVKLQEQCVSNYRKMGDLEELRITIED